MWAWNISFEIFHFWQFFLKYFNDQKKQHVFFEVLDAHKLTQCLELDQFVLFQWHENYDDSDDASDDDDSDSYDRDNDDVDDDNKDDGMDNDE